MSCSTTNSELPDALQVRERCEQRLRVGGVKAGGRLVERIDDAEQVRPDLRGEAQSLQLARRQRRRAAVERQVAEPQIGRRTRCASRMSAAMLLCDQRLSGRFSARRAHLPPSRPSRYGSQQRRQPVRAAGATVRRCRARRTSPTATRGRRRLPWHSGTVGAHQVLRDTRFLTSALCVVANVCSTKRRALRERARDSSAPPCAAARAASPAA